MRLLLDRRQFALLGTAMALDATAVRSQTMSGKPRRVGVMMAVGEGDPEGMQRLEALKTSLGEAGWTDGIALLIDVVWYRGNSELAKDGARRLLERGCDVIVVNGTPGMDALRNLRPTLPIVFVVVSNPVGAGYVTNLSRPGVNITGFSTFEPEMSGKWLQLLKQLSPSMKHVNMLLDPNFTGFNALWEAVAEIAPKHGITAHAARASNLQEIEGAIAAIAKQDAPGLIVSPSPINTVHRQRLISLANANRIPAIYPFRFYVRDGALLAYGFNAADQFKRAGHYVDRILKGERAGDLPVQAPTLFEFGVNLKTAKAMGISVPQSLLIAADEIVE
jgi:putative tryptophan/tyrosine transport system substrate-binding protein